MKSPRFVKKRSGHIVRFDRDKIATSLIKTLHHMDNHDHELAERITHEVGGDLRHLHQDTVSVDEIRSSIVRALKRHSLKHIADTYDFVFLNLGHSLVEKVIKRDGRQVAFHPYKIFKGIKKSLDQVGISDPLKAELLTKSAVNLIEKKYGREGIVPVENIKETVEYMLVRHKLGKAARAYILDRYL